MKFKYDNFSKEELEQKLIQLRLESEESKIKTEAKIEAIRKEREESKLKNEAEIEAIRKEREESKLKTEAEIEAFRKEREESKLKTDAEIEILRKETEAIRKETESIRKEREESKLKTDAEIETLRKETESIRKEREESKLKTDAEIEILRKETEAIKKESEAIRKETDIIRKDTEANINGLSSKYKNLGNNIGQTFEEGMINGLMKSEYFLKNKFDKAFPRMVAKNKKNVPVMEVDMVFVNTTTLAIVELKHGVTNEDLDDIVQNRIPNFRKYFNNFRNFDIIVYLGGGAISKKVVDKAKKLGLGILRPSNDIFIQEVEAKVLDKGFKN